MEEQQVPEMPSLKSATFKLSSNQQSAKVGRALFNCPGGGAISFEIQTIVKVLFDGGDVGMAMQIGTHIQSGIPGSRVTLAHLDNGDHLAVPRRQVEDYGGEGAALNHGGWLRSNFERGFCNSDMGRRRSAENGQSVSIQRWVLACGCKSVPILSQMITPSTFSKDLEISLLNSWKATSKVRVCIPMANQVGKQVVFVRTASR